MTDDVNVINGTILQVARLLVTEGTNVQNVTLSNLFSIVEDKVLTSENAIISPSVLITSIATDGDADLDNAILPIGKHGQLKIVYCSVLANVGDSWKITPSALLGGTQITFAAVGAGCIMTYNEIVAAWCIIANNGGIVS